LPAVAPALANGITERRTVASVGAGAGQSPAVAPALANGITERRMVAVGVVAVGVVAADVVAGAIPTRSVGKVLVCDTFAPGFPCGVGCR
jgi:hypothetical protein